MRWVILLGIVSCQVATQVHAQASGGPAVPLGTFPMTMANHDVGARFAGRGDSLRLILIGDTGKPNKHLDANVRAIAAERPDLVIITGDLVYQKDPFCPTVLSAKDEQLLDARIGRPLSRIGSPIVLTLGNHDVETEGDDVFQLEAEHCFHLWVRKNADRFVLPARHFTISLPMATLSLLSTTGALLDDAAADFTRRAFASRSDDWDILVGHHQYQTYGTNHATDEHLRPWVISQGLRPDIVLNGHEHALQLSDVKGVIAVTSGAGARTDRKSQDCRSSSPRRAGCGRYQIFGTSANYGYVVLDLIGSERAVFRFRDANGTALWGCAVVRERPGCTELR